MMGRDSMKSMSLIVAGFLGLSVGSLAGQGIGSLRVSCGAGKATACTDLGSVYFNGQGVAQDSARSVILWGRGCDGGAGVSCAHSPALELIVTDDAVPPRSSPTRGEPGRKSALLAGLLSAYVPGVGSFYAGAEGHGWRHLGIMLGAPLALLPACGLAAITEIGEVCGVSFGLALAAILVNWPWSIVTAVQDANGYNEPGETSGEPSVFMWDGVSVEPGVRLFFDVPSWNGSDSGVTRANLELVRVRF